MVQGIQVRVTVRVHVRVRVRFRVRIRVRVRVRVRLGLGLEFGFDNPYSNSNPYSSASGHDMLGFVRTRVRTNPKLSPTNPNFFEKVRICVRAKMKTRVRVEVN